MPTAAFDRPNRLKAREEGTIKWGELLEKFKSVQEKARRTHQSHDRVEDGTPAISVANESSLGRLARGVSDRNKGKK